jgi:hypothetical protein
MKKLGFEIIQIIVYAQLVLIAASGPVQKSDDENKHGYGNIAKYIALFGNGVVALSVHHTLIVVNYGEHVENDNQTYRYRLLEVVDAQNGIEIHDVKGETEIQVLEQRMRTEFKVNRWGSDAAVNCYDSTIKKVIDRYTGKKYIPYNPFGPRNCRTFVNDVLRACGSSKKTYGFFRNEFVE